MVEKVDEVVECQFCLETYSKAETMIDRNEEGFWCDCCDGFTYLTEIEHTHKFTLILEDKSKSNNVTFHSTAQFNKRLSPLRYPGGKSKLVNYLYSKIQPVNTKQLVGVYAGGASVELAMLHAGVVEEVILNDYDFGIYSLFSIIKSSPYDLINKINSNRAPTHKDFFIARDRIKNNYKNSSHLEAAWAVLLTNRLAYSGIVKANPLGGRTGSEKALRSRWNPTDLCKRISTINKMSDRISVTNIDAVELIEEYYWHPQTTLFIDPPYYDKGKQLYHCFYNENQHIELRMAVDMLHQGCPGADMILTYDNHDFIKQLYEYPTLVERINRVYSV